MALSPHSRYDGMTMNEILYSAGIDKQFDDAIYQKNFELAVQLLVNAEIATEEGAKEYVDDMLLYRERFITDNSKPFKPPSSNCIMEFVKELNKLGAPISFPAELNLLQDIPDGFYSALVKSLLECDDDDQQWIMMGYFHGIKGNLDGKPIIDIYEKAQVNGRTRFHITEIFYKRQVSGIDDWLHDILNLDGMSERDIGLLPLVLSRLSNSDRTRETLRNVFSRSPVRAAMALGTCGEKEDAEFLHAQVKEFKGWERSKIEGAISAINERLDI